MRAFILAGGAGRRLGSDKSEYKLAGLTMLERMRRILFPIFHDRIIISRGTGGPERTGQGPGVYDNYPGKGPLSGIESCLSVAETGKALFVAVDLQLVRVSTIANLVSESLRSGDDIVPEIENEKPPLCMVISTDKLKMVREMLESNQLSLIEFLERAGVKKRGGFAAGEFLNLNTVSECEFAEKFVLSQRRETPPIIRVSGVSGSGKTVLMEKLVRGLKCRGLRVGTVKDTHHHQFGIDRKGKDSYRHFVAGAKGSALVSDSGWFFREERERISLASLVERNFREYDIVLAEGFKQEIFPGISLTEETKRDTGISFPIEIYRGTSREADAEDITGKLFDLVSRFKRGR